MKKLTLTLLIASTCNSVAGTWEWTFDSDVSAATVGNGTLKWSTPDAHSLAAFKTTDGTTVPHINGVPAGYLSVPGYNDPADFPQLYFNDSVPNGGGQHLNKFSIVMDVYFTAPYAWLPFFNTNPDDADDADLYISPSGALGIGNLGYTEDGAVSTGAWHRLIFAADLGAGIVTYFIDGVQAYEYTGDSLLDGRFSLNTGTDAAADLILGNEGDESDIYTREWLLAAFALTDHTLTADEATALGGPKAAGIYVGGGPPAPPTLQISTGAAGVTLNWNQSGFLLQRSTNLATWSPVANSTTMTTYSESAAGTAWFRLATP